MNTATAWLCYAVAILGALWLMSETAPFLIGAM